MNELKPCPYCGYKVDSAIHMDFGLWSAMWVVRCPECLAQTGNKETHQEVTEAWNRRVYDYDMPGISKKIEALQAELELLNKLSDSRERVLDDFLAENLQLKEQLSSLEALFTEQGKQLNRLLEANHRMADLLFSDGERDTNGYTVAALVSALQQYARRENWTRNAEIEYSIDDYTEAGSVRLDTPIVWKCGSPGYTLAEAALNGDIDVSGSEGNTPL